MGAKQRNPTLGKADFVVGISKSRKK